LLFGSNVPLVESGSPCQTVELRITDDRYEEATELRISKLPRRGVPKALYGAAPWG
jgi:hypothetical protein